MHMTIYKKIVFVPIKNKFIECYHMVEVAGRPYLIIMGHLYFN